MIGIGVIGYGYWGPNLVRNFVEIPNARVVCVADLRPERLDLVRRRHPNVATVTDYRELLRDPRIDAVAISTPVSTHAGLAMEVLAAGKHVLVEKPMTMTSEEGLRLIDEADKRNLVLMVDHTFVYTGAVRKIKEYVDSGALGDIYYYDSTRVNLGLIQHDVDVVWDLAVHDLSIMDYIFGESPLAVSATGIGHVMGAAENIAYVTAFYGSSQIAHLNVNWLSPVKLRRTLIAGNKKMIVYDDIESSEKVKIYDKGISVQNGVEARYRALVSYRSGDMYAPQLDMTEALRVEAQHFLDCIVNGDVPITDGVCGLRIVAVLEAASKSMRERGRAIQVEPCGLRNAAVV
jgi:predicted dehydrogenase